MPIDNSVSNPGKMGWGVDSETIQNKHSYERMTFGRIAESLPQFVARKDPKQVVNKVIYDKLIDLTKANGAEDGVDLRGIEFVTFGGWQNWLAQLIGSCVASGAMRVLTRRTMIETFVFGQFQELLGTQLDGVKSFAPFGPYHYRGGRRIAGINSGDGSYCSVQIEAFQKYGFLPCSTPGLSSDAFPEPQDESLYRKWGNSSGNALMDAFKGIEKIFILNESEEVTDPDQFILLCTEHLKGAMICSDWAFRPDFQHDSWKLADGSPVWIYKRDTATSWAHNMSVIGAVKYKGQWYIIIENSWGKNAHKNGHYFVIPIEVFGKWLKDAECRTIGDLSTAASDKPLVWAA